MMIECATFHFGESPEENLRKVRYRCGLRDDTKNGQDSTGYKVLKRYYDGLSAKITLIYDSSDTMPYYVERDSADRRGTYIARKHFSSRAAAERYAEQLANGYRKIDNCAG